MIVVVISGMVVVVIVGVTVIVIVDDGVIGRDAMTQRNCGTSSG